MSVNYTVERKGFGGKPINNMSIIGDLGFGVLGNGNCLDERPPENGEEFIIYDKNRIGRGISVVPSKNKIELRMLSPDSPEEIDVFFDVIERIGAEFKKFRILEEDEEEVPLSEIPQKREYFKDFNRKTVQQFTSTSGSSVSFEDGHCLLLFSARFPLELDRETADAIHNSPDPAAAFGDWLHSCQSTKAEYLVPRFYQSDDAGGKLIGVYFIEENTDYIVPLKPKAPFGAADENGRPIEIDAWRAVYISSERNAPAGEVDYEKFISAVRENSRPFDGGSVIVRVTEEQRTVISDQ